MTRFWPTISRAATVVLAAGVLVAGLLAPSVEARRPESVIIVGVVKGPPPPPIELGARNHITASFSGYREVDIARTAKLRFSFFRNPDLTIRGPGRFNGVFLVQQDVEKPAAVYAGRFRLCYEPACNEGMSWFFMFPQGIKWKKTLDIPPGRYRLYVVTDGAPVSATLSLEGLKGERRISPSEGVSATVGSDAAEPPINNVYAGGSTYALPNRGLGITSFWHDSSARVATVETDCLYKGRPPAPDAVAYGPACRALGGRAGAGVSFAVPPVVSGGGGGSISFDPQMPAGQWSYGGSYVAPEKVDFAAFISVWMSYK